MEGWDFVSSSLQSVSLPGPHINLTPMQAEPAVLQPVASSCSNSDFQWQQRSAHTVCSLDIYL